MPVLYDRYARLTIKLQRDSASEGFSLSSGRTGASGFSLSSGRADTTTFSLRENLKIIEGPTRVQWPFPVSGPVTINGDGLRMTFSGEKRIKNLTNPNTMTVAVYNLNADSRAQIRDEGMKLTLEAGYTGGPWGHGFAEILGIGDLRFVESHREGADWVTRMECGDGDRAQQYSHVNKSFAAGTQLPDIIKEVTDEMKKFIEVDGSILATIVNAIRRALTEPDTPGTSLVDTVTKAATNLTVNAQKALEKLVTKHGLEGSIQNNRLQILDPEAVLDFPAIVINARTGLIGQVTRAEATETVGTEMNAATHRRRKLRRKIEIVRFQTLLLPSVYPGRLLTLDSNETTGDFKCISCKYSGDTHGGSWSMDVEARAYEP